MAVRKPQSKKETRKHRGRPPKNCLEKKHERTHSDASKAMQWLQIAHGKHQGDGTCLWTAVICEHFLKERNWQSQFLEHMYYWNRHSYSFNKNLMSTCCGPGIMLLNEGIISNDINNNALPLCGIF